MVQHLTIEDTERGRWHVDTRCSGFPDQETDGLGALIIGGLFAAYGVNYSATAATVLGLFLIIIGALVLILKIMRRNQDVG